MKVVMHMSLLGKTASLFFKMASNANTLNIMLSGNPKRILRHMLRKKMYKHMSSVGRYKKQKGLWMI